MNQDIRIQIWSLTPVALKVNTVLMDPEDIALEGAGWGERKESLGMLGTEDLKLFPRVNKKYSTHGYLREALDYGAKNQIWILLHLLQESNIQATKEEVTPIELTEITFPLLSD